MNIIIDTHDKNRKSLPIHSGLLRLLHAFNALSVIGLISSGWAIYNASPFYPIIFPLSFSLGGYLTEALRWHFALMWVFLVTSITLIFLRLPNSHGGPALTPISPKSVFMDIKSALTLRMTHHLGCYNQVQRLFYVSVFILFICLIVSGVTLWKPVQFQFITNLIGGFQMTRAVHFWAMIGICSFIFIHLIMVILVPRTLLAMIFGAKKTNDDILN